VPRGQIYRCAREKSIIVAAASRAANGGECAKSQVLVISFR
jgi:hypothetical protein